VQKSFCLNFTPVFLLHLIQRNPQRARHPFAIGRIGLEAVAYMGLPHLRKHLFADLLFDGHQPYLPSNSQQALFILHEKPF
jgi:hypothetical protein